MAADEKASVPPVTIGKKLHSRSLAVAAQHLQITDGPMKEFFAGSIIDEKTGEALEYRDLIKRPDIKEIWERSLANELGRLSQGARDIKGTNTIFFIKKSDIPTDRLKDVTYGRIVVDYRPNKSDPNRSRLTAGGHKINYPYDVSAPTCGIPVIKLHFNSVLSTPDAKFAVFDISNFYLNCKLKRPEYMRIKLIIGEIWMGQ